MKALLSAYNRAGLVEFARSISKAGFGILSTGGTGKELSGAGISVQQVSEYTGSPEILDGRVKTLHPKVHGGILARRSLQSHTSQMAEHGIDSIDLVAVNLYPFVQTVSRPGVTLDDALENIDIGGPTIIRAAAKNFPDVIVVVDPADYGWIAERIASGGAGAIALEERKALARKAFQHVSVYDSAVSRYLGESADPFAAEVGLGFTKLGDLRYGENPHQRGAVYADPLAAGGIVRAEQLNGMEMSYTNYLDAEAAWKTVKEFASTAVCIVKHTNPCGVAIHADQAQAYRNALAGDPISAYGGIVGFNTAVTTETAAAMKGVLYHIIVAPDYEPEALAIFRKRNKDTRVLKVQRSTGSLNDLEVRLVSGGALLQTADNKEEDFSTWKVVTNVRPTAEQISDLHFATKVLPHIKSNAVVLAKERTMVGMGAGQPNRVTSIHLALRSSGAKAKGSVMASDAFLPNVDNVELAHQGGIVAISQAGGSKLDQDMIDTANRLGVAMVLTGVRHFTH
ncbi:MAG: bifunctional phosphoribosylaminoimidazolecarboxamide formyltransferase/IMP cyclohydrolase [SAR202 cluster bacterium]|nr:bifunctional phosphoribosylaminoimidazolecarboxamide formyltransferase/IMP cyclohydrolase [SAR202 cluster bacterium]